MPEESTNQETGDSPANGPTVSTTRQRSEIAFPYADLDAASALAGVVYKAYGGRCTIDQLAGSLNTTVTSGSFRLRISAARMFGFIATSKQGVSTTALAAQVVDERTAKSARAQAFLHVPLYRALYDRYLQRTLPGDQGLEAAIRELGVPEKQVNTARQVFQRSAQQAGFFEHGRDRLVMPAVGTLQREPEIKEPEKHDRVDGGSDGTPIQEQGSRLPLHELCLTQSQGTIEHAVHVAVPNGCRSTRAVVARTREGHSRVVLVAFTRAHSLLPSEARSGWGVSSTEGA